MILSHHRMHGNNLVNLCESVEKRYELDELNEWFYLTTDYTDYTDFS